MADERTRYSDAELEEFRQLILKKLENARADYELLRATITHTADNDTEDTSPAGFRLDAVVEALVARRCIGIRHAGAVGREPVGGVRAGSCGTDREDRCRPNQDQGKYAEPGEHCVKDNGFFRQKVRHRGLN